MKKNFVIVTLPRSGSYHLASLLDSASDIKCYGEVFKGNKVELPARTLAKLGLGASSTTERDKEGSALLERLFDLSPEPVQGFKAFPDQLARSGIRVSLHRTGWKYIFLVRNPIEAFVSLQRAKQTGIFVLGRSEKRPEPQLTKPVYINPCDLISSIEWRLLLYEKWRAIVKTHGQEHATMVEYKSLQYSRKRERLLEFLGSASDPKTLTSDRAKQFTRPFWEGVFNASEVIEALKAADHEHLLSEIARD